MVEVLAGAPISRPLLCFQKVTPINRHLEAKVPIRPDQPGIRDFFRATRIRQNSLAVSCILEGLEGWSKKSLRLLRPDAA